MRLDIDMLGPEELLGPVASQVLHDVHVLATSVVAAAGITFGILVGQHAADRLHHCQAGVVLAGDHFQTVLLADFFGSNGGENGRGFRLEDGHFGSFEAGTKNGVTSGPEQAILPERNLGAQGEAFYNERPTSVPTFCGGARTSLLPYGITYVSKVSFSVWYRVF